MIQNYIKIAFRNLWRNKLYTSINIIGLMVAMSVITLISLYLKDDLSFDKMHKNGDHIYRLVCDVTRTNGDVGKTGNTGHIQGPTFKNEVPEIEAFCRFKNGWNTLVKKGNDAFLEEMIYADSSVLDIFSFNVLEGSHKTNFSKPNEIIITEKIANKYFNTTDVIGKILNISDGGSEFSPFEVAAVIKDLPSNSSFQFDILGSFDHMIKVDEQYQSVGSWMHSSLNTFVLLNNNANVINTEEKINKVTSLHIQKEYNADRTADPNAKPYSMNFHLQPLFDMHLDPEYFATNGLSHWSDIKYPKILIGIALLLLCIAAINSINLALARSFQRQKEIGIRKSAGGTKGQLFNQFMTESFITTILAIVPAVMMTTVLLKPFSDLTNKYINSSSLTSISTWPIYALIVCLIAFASGIYPAMVISRLNPIDILKGKTTFQSNQSLQKSLIVFQFSMASVLIMATIFATNQFNFINSKPLGYDTADRYRFWLPWEQISKLSGPFKSELKNLSGIAMVSGKSGDFNSTTLQIPGHESDYIFYEHIDDNHLQLMNIPLTKGRYLSYQYGQDTVSNIVVNESFVEKLLPPNTDPLNFPIRSRGNLYNIVGVTKNFHYQSFKEEIKPMMFILDRGTEAGQLYIKINPGQASTTLPLVHALFKKHVPYIPIELESLEDFRISSYDEEIREKKIVTATALLAILIASLGLFGLATFMVEQRTKEIGIRKVLGAGLNTIMYLLSKDFIKLVLIAFAIALPLAYYLIDKWLDSFVYRIEMKWWMFVICGMMIIIIALITVSFQSIRAGLMNPVKSLKVE